MAFGELNMAPGGAGVSGLGVRGGGRSGGGGLGDFRPGGNTIDDMGGRRAGGNVGYQDMFGGFNFGGLLGALMGGGEGGRGAMMAPGGGGDPWQMAQRNAQALNYNASRNNIAGISQDPMGILSPEALLAMQQNAMQQQSADAAQARKMQLLGSLMGSMGSVTGSGSGGGGGAGTGLYGQVINPVLDSLVPGEQAARRQLTDQFRLAGNLGSGAFTEALGNLEGELGRARGTTAANTRLGILGPEVQARGQNIGALSSLFNALMGVL